MEQPNTEIPTFPQPENIQPAPVALPPKKSNLSMIFVMILLLVLFTGVGIVLGKYVLNPTTSSVEKLVLPTPSPAEASAKAGTPTPDPTTNWKTYTNKDYKFLFSYPASNSGSESSSLKELDNKPAGQYQITVQTPGLNFILDIQNLTPEMAKNLLGSPLKETVILNSIKWDILTNKGYCDAGSCGPPFLAYQTIKNDIRFSFVFNNTTTETKQQKDIISTFKFLDQTQTDVTINWQTFTSQCGLTVKYPQQWKARTSFLPNIPKSDNPKYNYDCVYITAPDYTQGIDSREGLYISISGTTIGTTSKPVDIKISPYPINTIDNYIKSMEDSVITEPEPFKAKNVQTKTYGTFTGKYYETAAFEEHASFVFIKSSTIFNISWPKNYNGQYKNNIEAIINSSK